MDMLCKTKYTSGIDYNLSNRKSSYLTKDDDVVACGGANNLGKMILSKGLECMTHFVQIREIQIW
jgi:hypothetical protein